MHLMSSHFFFRCPDKAQLAVSQVAISLHCRTEGATDHRSVFVKLTLASFRIESRTGFGVGEVIPPFCRFVRIIFVEYS